ncbi:Aminomethyltransferase [Lachancea thermotolerans]
MIFKRLSSSAALKKTALYDLHVQLGGTMVPFAGYAMPVKYAGQTHVESHIWTRTHAGLFDVSHMLQSRLEGPGATQFLHRVTPTDFQALPAGQGTLSVLLNARGGIVDDTLITKVADNKFSIVTNAGRAKEDIAFLNEQVQGFECRWEPVCDRALLALQGPEAKDVLGSLVAGGLQSLQDLYFGQRRSFRAGTGVEIDVARSGYTGEDGFEVSVANSDATDLARMMLENSAVRAIGLAARDSLRLEAGMCLYGHELDEDTTPVEASLNWLISKSRRDGSLGEFNGFSHIMGQIANKSATRARVGFKYLGKGPAARTDAPVFSDEGKTQVGHVTSGSAAPSLAGINIGQAYVQKGLHKAGTQLFVGVRNKIFPIQIARMPLVPSHYYKSN